jgi:DNA-binding CsgD family transcriptional regulator
VSSFGVKVCASGSPLSRTGIPWLASSSTTPTRSRSNCTSWQPIRARCSWTAPSDRAGDDPPEVIVLTTFDQDDLVLSALRRVDRLAATERRMADAVALGLSNAQIAERLVVSVATVKSYVSRLLTKLVWTSAPRSRSSSMTPNEAARSSAWWCWFRGL